LEKVGVSAGDTLNIVKGNRRRSESKTVDDLDGISSDNGDIASGFDSESLAKGIEGIDPSQLEQARQQMGEMLDSDFIDQYFSDETKLVNLISILKDLYFVIVVS